MKNRKNLMLLGRSIVAGLMLVMATEGLVLASVKGDAASADAGTSLKAKEKTPEATTVASQETDNRPAYYAQLIQKLKNAPCDGSL